MNIPNASDADEANDVYNFIQTHFGIKPEEREGTSAYTKPSMKSTDVTIYNMTEIDQNKLIFLLRAEKSKRTWRKIEITFYEKEILNRVENTTIRGKEKLLRTEILR